MQWVEVQKHGLVSRKEKGRRSVVFCSPKDYEATGVALLSRLIIVGSSPTTSGKGVWRKGRRDCFWHNLTNKM